MQEDPFFIDFVTECVGGDFLAKSHDANELTAVALYGRFFDFVPVNKALNIDREMLLCTPSETTIVDMGAGRQSRFTEEQLRERGHVLVNVDHLYEFEPCRPKDTSWKVGCDMTVIPRAITETSLIDGLVKFEASDAADGLRKQVRILIQIVQARPIGMFIFSHSLQNLSEEHIRNVLRLAMNSICPNGYIYILDKSNARHAEGRSGTARPSPASIVNEMLANTPTIRLVEDRLIVPAVTQAQLTEGDPRIEVRKFLSDVAGGSVVLRRFNGDFDNGEEIVDIGDGLTGIMRYAERIMVLTKVVV